MPSDPFAAYQRPFGRSDPFASYQEPAAQSTPDFTSNPNGEGLYRMGSYDFQQGNTSEPEIQVPYSRVQDALKAGYKLHPDETPRFQKDTAHEGEAPTLWERMDAGIQKILTPEAQRQDKPARSDINNTLRAAGRVLYGTPEYVRNVWAAYQDSLRTGNANELLDLIDPSQLPKNLIDQYQADRAKDPRLAVQNLVGRILGTGVTVAATHGAFKVVGAGTRSLMDTATKAREEALRTATRTGPVARQMVEDTAKENAKIAQSNQRSAAVADARNQERAAAHQESVQSALHETAGREQAHRQAVASKTEEIRAQEASEAAKMQKDLEDARAKVRQANEENRKLADQKNATAKAKHDAQVAEHQRLTEATSRLNADDRTFKTQLQKTYSEAKREANAKYEGLRGELDDTMANPEFLPEVVLEASEKMRGSETVPKILQDMESRIKRGDAPTFNDLQGYRTEIGAELQKRLPDDVYYAYRGLLDSIDDEMARIASSKSPGLAKQLAQARDFYRLYAQAFLDRSSPLRKILDDPEPHGFLRRVRGKEVSGVAAIHQFNPQLADAAQSALGLMDDIRAPRAVSPLMPPKPLGPAPEPVQPRLTPEPATPPARLTAGGPEERAAQSVKPPERVPIPDRPQQVTTEVKPNKVLTPAEVSAAKRERAIERADQVRNSSDHVFTVFAVLDLAQAVLRHQPLPLARDLVGRVGYAVGKNMYANFLESPKVLGAVEKLTDKDVRAVMELPPDQREGFDQLLLAAQTKGITLKPGVLSTTFGMVAATPKLQGEKTKYLKRLREQGAYTDPSTDQEPRGGVAAVTQ